MKAKSLAVNLGRRLFASLGLDVQRVSAIHANSEALRRERIFAPWRYLARYSPSCVLDIGANDGLFAQIVCEIIPTARIISFEPIPECFESVDSYLKSAAKGCAVQVALGDETGVLEFQLSRFTPSSSLLQMTDKHLAEYPQSSLDRKIQVQVKPLDAIAADLALQTPMIIKIDVQGFEDRVIRGGTCTIKQARAVVIECSTVSLYAGQALFPEIHELMRELGFTFRGVIEQSYSHIDGSIVQFDAIFENDELNSSE